jgi:hypothetical protein
MDVNEMTCRTIPEHLMPDENNQFLNGTFVCPDDYWMAYDSWDMETAVKLITIGSPMDFEKKAEEVKGWPLDALGRDVFGSQCHVYSRGFGIAKSSIAIGRIKNPDTPQNWIHWALSKGYNTDHLDPIIQIQKFELTLSELEPEFQASKESYQEQLAGWQKIANLWGWAKAEPTPGTDPETQPGNVYIDEQRTQHFIDWLKNNNVEIIDGIITDASYQNKTVIHAALKTAAPSLWNYVGADAFNKWWRQQPYKLKPGRRGN